MYGAVDAGFPRLYRLVFYFDIILCAMGFWDIENAVSKGETSDLAVSLRGAAFGFGSEF